MKKRPKKKGHHFPDDQFLAQNLVKTKKRSHHFPDDQFLAQNVVKIKQKKVIWFADVGHENIGGDAVELLGGYISPSPPRFAPMARGDFASLQPVKSCPFKLFTNFFTSGILKISGPSKIPVPVVSPGPSLNGHDTVKQNVTCTGNAVLHCTATPQGCIIYSTAAAAVLHNVHIEPRMP